MSRKIAEKAGKTPVRIPKPSKTGKIAEEKFYFVARTV